MSIPWIRGRVAPQAHVGVPEGTFEEEYARNGFSGRYAHLYRAHAPVGWTRVEGPLKPRAFSLTEDKSASAKAGDDWLAQRVPILRNQDVSIGIARLTKEMPYLFRNGDADEVLFVHEGAGTLHTDFGPLAYERGDYLVVPRGTSHRLAPTSPSFFLAMEVFSEVGFPERGMLGQHALFDPAVIAVPNPEEQVRDASHASDASKKEHELRIQRSGEITKVFYPFDPLDVVGWKGTLAPMRLHTRDIRPVMSERYHLPPSAHSTFVAREVVICTFLPRALETGDPLAMRVPFYHSNIDFDEVLFYHDGDFFSREGIEAGMLTFHPQGIHHGPQPGATKKAAQKARTDEVAVMIDTRRPLKLCDAARALEIDGYVDSWKAK